MNNKILGIHFLNKDLILSNTLFCWKMLQVPKKLVRVPVRHGFREEKNEEKDMADLFNGCTICSISSLNSW